MGNNNAPIIRNNNSNSNKFEAVRLVEAPSNNTKQGLTRIAKDENGLIATTKVELNLSTNQWQEKVQLTAKSLHRALVENITSSNIEAINVIFRAVLADAQRQASDNTFQYVQGLMGSVNTAMADYKQETINIQKEYSSVANTPSVSAWDGEIDIYNMGTPIVGTMGGEEVIDIKEVEEEYTGVEDI